ncbi:MAG: hypothetical protein JWN62_2165 [Acidimicrobiales bacterium]|nr:hypothetical protein [Acidimicrobiales bacterium]
MGGLALFSIAGARETQASYDTYLRSVGSSTMSVTTFQAYDARSAEAIAAIPGVALSRTYVGFNVNVLVNDVPDFSIEFETIGTFDGRFFDQDRFTATAGRLADPDRPDEVDVNEFAASRYGFTVGQRLDLGVYSVEQWQDPTFFEAPSPPMHRQTVTIVGIGVFPDEAVHDDGDRTQQLLITPALSAQLGALSTYGVQGLVLEHGDDGVAAVRAAISDTVPAGAVEFHSTAEDARHARRALQPLSITLTLFGVVVGLVGLVLTAQALVRLHRAEHEERSMLRVFGASPRSIATASVVPLVVVVVLGVLLAVVIAVAASPLMPIGPVRRLQTAHSFHADVPVLALGALLIVVILGTALSAIVWSEAPERQSRRARRRRRPLAASAAIALGLPPSAVVGVGAAFEADSSKAGVPTRSVIAGAALAVAAVVGALTFAASLTTLVDSPRAFGWNWDATVLDGNGYDNLDVAKATAIFASDPHIEAWSGAYFGTMAIAGEDVSVLGMDPASRVVPPIVDGRMIASATEIVLGAGTASALGKRVGDDVEVTDDAGDVRSLHIVGTAIFPSIGRVHTEHVSLGTGAIVVPALVPGHDYDILGEPGTDLGPHVAFLRFSAATSTVAELARLQQTVAPLGGFAGIGVVGAQRPAEIVNSDSINDAPLLVAAALALSAAISLALALGGSVRRRNRDLAVLAALGFTRRQLAATVAWQATSTIVVGLAIGIPGGVLLGRQLWVQFADRLHVVPVVTLPRTLLVVAAGAVVVANVVAALPARSARSVEASRLTRSAG